MTNTDTSTSTSTTTAVNNSWLFHPDEAIYSFVNMDGGPVTERLIVVDMSVISSICDKRVRELDEKCGVDCIDDEGIHYKAEEPPKPYRLAIMSTVIDKAALTYCKEKILDTMRSWGVPCTAMISLDANGDGTAKILPFFLKEFNNNMALDLETSFVLGPNLPDAETEGRPLKFAKSNRLSYMTVDQFKDPECQGPTPSAFM
jgi:hypothetical protein